MGSQSADMVPDSLLKRHADDSWYARMFGQQMGPMPLNELLAMFDAGEITMSDEVRPDADGLWYPAGILNQATNNEPEVAPPALDVATPKATGGFSLDDDIFEYAEDVSSEFDSGKIYIGSDIEKDESTPANETTESGNTDIPPKPSFVKSKKPHPETVDDDQPEEHAGFDPNRYKLRIPQQKATLKADKSSSERKLSDTVAETSLASTAFETPIAPLDNSLVAKLPDEEQTAEPETSPEPKVAPPALPTRHLRPKVDDTAVKSVIQRAKNENYFCWHDSRERGPVDYGRLQRRIVSNKLTKGEYVKRESDGVWIDCTTIAGLFPDIPVSVPKPKPPINPKQSVPQNIASVTDWSQFDQTDGSPEDDGSFEISEGLVDELGEDDSVTEFVTTGKGLETSTKPRSRNSSWNEDFWGADQVSSTWLVLLKEPIVQGIIAIAVIACLAWMFIVPTPSTSVRDRFAEIAKEIEYRRSKNVTRKDWAIYIEETRAEIDPIIEELEKTASSEDRIRQELLWAGRDCLVFMLSNTVTEKVVDAEAEFDLHMEAADKLIKGGSLDLIPIQK